MPNGPTRVRAVGGRCAFDAAECLPMSISLHPELAIVTPRAKVFVRDHTALKAHVETGTGG
jgi:hypothetical protein